MALLEAISVHAGKSKTVSAHYVYYAPEQQSLEEAKSIAYERAIIDAIAEEFGTNISQTNYSDIRNRNGRSSINFQSLRNSDLRGEWIGDKEDPEYSVYYKDGLLVVECFVKGVIRERSNQLTDFNCKLLRNAPSLEYESSEFRNGDNLYLYFQSPESGYLTVYFIDEDETAYCILPYKNQSIGAYPIKANETYTFFSKHKAVAEDISHIDEYVMTCGNRFIRNRIYILFSTNKYSRAIDDDGLQNMPRSLPYRDFTKWLSNCRNADENLNVRQLELQIKER